MENRLFDKINFEIFLEHLPTGVVVHKMNTEIVYANKTALKLLGLTFNQIIGKDALSEDWEFVNEYGNSLALEEYPVNKVKNEKVDLEEYVVGIKYSEAITWIVTNGYINSFEDESYIIITFTDISRSNKIPFREIVDNARDAVVVTSSEPLEEPFGPKIEYVNKAFCDISGYSKDELIGNTPRILQKDETNKETLKEIKDALVNKKPIRETLLNFNKDGKPYWLDISIFPLFGYTNKVTHFAAIERDISQMKESELLNIEASRTDHMTQLLNRRGFEILSEDLIENETITEYSIITLDIDKFKNINDTYGHDIGDKVIISLAKMILSVSRKDDICARLGGEEFVLVLPHVNLKQAKNIAQRIRLEVSETEVKTELEIIKFTVSLGISHSNQNDSIELILKNADKALYEAKRSGRNKVVVFEE